MSQIPVLFAIIVFFRPSLVTQLKLFFFMFSNYANIPAFMDHIVIPLTISFCVDVYRYVYSLA